MRRSSLTLCLNSWIFTGKRINTEAQSKGVTKREIMGKTDLCDPLYLPHSVFKLLDLYRKAYQHRGTAFQRYTEGIMGKTNLCDALFPRLAGFKYQSFCLHPIPARLFQPGFRRP